MSVPKDTLKSVSNRVGPRGRISRVFAAGVLLIGVSALGASLSSALSASAVDQAYTYDCSGSAGRITTLPLGPGDTLTITVTGTGCGGVLSSVTPPDIPAADPVLTKNGTPIPTGSGAGVSAGDLLVLTAPLSGAEVGFLQFESISGFTYFDWTIDYSIGTTTTTQPTSTTTIQPATTTTIQSPTSTTAPDGADAGSATGDRVAPAFTG